MIHRKPILVRYHVSYKFYGMEHKVWLVEDQ